MSGTVTRLPRAAATPAGSRFPPAAPVWDGDPTILLEDARVMLRIATTDPDMPRLAQVVDTVMEQVRLFLDCFVPFDDASQTAAIPATIYQACLLATVEGYRRKDATFGLSGSFTADGIPVKISNDWLAPVRILLAPYKERWGLA
jgi:hypothetical protein